jgi:hypothetical protein
MVVGLWPVLLTGIYAMNRRKAKITINEKADAVATAVAKANAEAENKLKLTKEAAEKEKEAAVAMEVEKALKEADRKLTEDQASLKPSKPETPKG